MALLAALVLPLLVVWPFRHHPPAVLALKEVLFQVLLLASVLATCHRGIRGHVLRQPPVLLAAALALWLWLSASLSPWPDVSFREAALGTALALLVVVAAAAGAEGAEREGKRRTGPLLCDGIAVAAGLVASYYLAQRLVGALPGGMSVGPTFDLTTDSPSGTFADRNQLATLFVFAWPSTLLLASRTRVAGKVLALVVLAALAVTRTEGAWLGALAAMLYLLWASRPAGSAPSPGVRVRRTAGVLLLLLVIGGTGGVCAVALGGGKLAGTLPRIPSVLERAALWNLARRGAESEPLLGSGPGTFDHVVRRHQAELLDEPGWEGVEYLSLHAHNDALETAATVGLPGLLLLAALLLAPLRRPPAFDAARLWAPALAAGLLGLLFHGLFHYPLQVSGIRGLAFAAAGLLAGAASRGSGADPAGALRGPVLRGPLLWIPGLLLCLPGLLVSVQLAVATAALDEGLAAGEEGRLAASELAFLRATVARPDWGVAWNGLGTARTLQGELSGAAEAMQRACELAPDDPEILANAATVAVLQGSEARGSRLFETALDINPLHVPSLRGLARLREDAGRRDEALSLYRKAVRLDPEDVIAAAGVRRLAGAEDAAP